MKSISVDFWRAQLHRALVTLGFFALLAIVSGVDVRFKPVDVNFSRNLMTPKIDFTQPQPICTAVDKVEKASNKKITDCNS